MRSRVADSNLDVCAGIWAHPRRADIGGHQVRHERVSRHGVRLLPQLGAGCQRLVCQLRGPSEARSAAKRFRQCAGRADQERQAVLLDGYCVTFSGRPSFRLIVALRRRLLCCC